MSVAKSLPTCARCGAELSAEGSDCPKCSGLDPRTNEIVAGKYRLERLLGRGGMGTVHLATDLGLERPCALKMLRPSLADEEDIVARFEKEARMLARLEHPNVVPIYAVERDGKVPFIVMKYLEGRTLSQLRRDMGRPWTAQELTPIVRQFCAGLGFMHQKGMVHRDLKPGNLFISGEGHCTILDLGIARDHDSTLTRPGLPMGTPHYMSPEQTATTRIDHRSDLYSLGVILYEALTGQLPFPGESEFDLMRAHRETPPPDASTVARVAPRMGKLLQRAMAKAPNERYQSAKELADAWQVGASSPIPDAVPDGAPSAPAVKPHTATPAGAASLVATPASQPGGALSPRGTPRPSASSGSLLPAPSKPPVLQEKKADDKPSKPPVLEEKKPEPPVLDEKKPEPPVLEEKKPEPPVLEEKKPEPPVLEDKKPEPPVLLEEKKPEPPVLEEKKPEPEPAAALGVTDASPALVPPLDSPALPVPPSAPTDPNAPIALPGAVSTAPADPSPRPEASKPMTPLPAAKPSKLEFSKPLTPIRGPSASRPDHKAMPRPEVSKALSPLVMKPPRASAPGSSSSDLGRVQPQPPNAMTEEVPAPTPPMPPKTSAPPGPRMSGPRPNAVSAPRASGLSHKPAPPVGDDPPTPVPVGADRFAFPDGPALGDEDPYEKTAMVPLPLPPEGHGGPQVVSLDGGSPGEGSASSTLSGDEDDDNPFGEDKTSVMSAPTRPTGSGEPPEPSHATLPTGVAGSNEPTGASPEERSNPWPEPESTASAVTPGEDFARRRTTESPLAQLSMLAGKPVVWIAGGGALLLLLIVVIVLLTRPEVPAAGSIIEVKQTPKSNWRNEEPPSPGPPQPKKPAPPPQDKAPQDKAPPEKAPVQDSAPPPEGARVEDKEDSKTPRAVKKVARTGELRVLTTMKGKAAVARILIDGVDKGHTPVVVQLALGKHEVIVDRPKGAAVVRSVKIAGDKPLVLKIELSE